MLPRHTSTGPPAPRNPLPVSQVANWVHEPTLAANVEVINVPDAACFRSERTLGCVAAACPERTDERPLPEPYPDATTTSRLVEAGGTGLLMRAPVA
jgi:hypothetical protein